MYKNKVIKLIKIIIVDKYISQPFRNNNNNDRYLAIIANKHIFKN